MRPPRSVRPAVVLLLLLVPACASPKPAGPAPQDQLVGRWVSTDDKPFTIEFTRDGTVRVGQRPEAGSLKPSGTYRFLDTKTVEWTRQPGGPPVRLLVITLSANYLAYIDKSTGGKHQFRRNR